MGISGYYVYFFIILHNPEVGGQGPPFPAPTSLPLPAVFAPGERQQAGPGGTTAWQGRFVLAVVSSQGRMLLAQVAFEWEMSPFKLLAPGAGGTP